MGYLNKKRRRAAAAGRALLVLALARLFALLAAVCQVQYALKKGASHFVALMSAHEDAARAAASGLPAGGCNSAPEAVNRLAAFSPDVRSVGQVVNGTVTCSSVTGARPVSFAGIYGIPVPDGDISLRSTPVLPGRPVIIFVQPAMPLAAASFVVMNAQALLRPAEDNAGVRLRYALRAGTGDVLDDGPAGRTLPGFTLRALRGQAMLTVSAPLSALLRRAAQNLPATAPLAALAVVLMGRRQAGPPRLRDALMAGMRRGEFSVHYQPVCETDSGRCGGAEALLRWTRADGEAISPEVFIAAAEREGGIIPLTRHLFSLIQQDAAAWTVPAGFRLAVNVAGSHLLQPDFLTDADALMAGLRARGITGIIEITERSLVSETRRAAAVLTRLRAAGAVVMLDDFGTGYSALSYLQALPVDGIKIDKRFIDDLSSPDAVTPVLDAIIGLGHRLGLEIVAEGVSEDTQRRGLLQRGVGKSQGYLYARPMDAAAFGAWITRRVRRARVGTAGPHGAGRRRAFGRHGGFLNVMAWMTVLMVLLVLLAVVLR